MMNKIFTQSVTGYSSIFLAGIAGFLICAGTLMAADRPFIVAGDEDEPPYGYINANKEFVGIYVDILREAFRRLDVPLQHEPYPWKRAQMMVLNGDADAMITVMTPERETFTVSSKEAIAELKWVAFARNDHPNFTAMKNYTTIAQFQGLRVLDYLGDGWGEQHLQRLKPDIGGSFSQVIQKLAADRGDVFIQMETVTKSQIKELMRQPELQTIGLEKIEALPHVLDSKAFYLLVAKESPYFDLLPQIDQVLVEMKRDGTIESIEKKYSE